MFLIMNFVIFKRKLMSSFDRVLIEVRLGYRIFNLNIMVIGGERYDWIFWM